jgi:hypothetical protein
VTATKPTKYQSPGQAILTNTAELDGIKRRYERRFGEIDFFFCLAHHGVEVGESADEGRELGEALLEGIAEVVGGVGGDDEHGLAGGGEEDGEDGAAGGLADAALAADEDPLEGVLVEEVPHRGLRRVAGVHHHRGRHAPIPAE